MSLWKWLGRHFSFASTASSRKPLSSKQASPHSRSRLSRAPCFVNVAHPEHLNKGRLSAPKPKLIPMYNALPPRAVWSDGEFSAPSSIELYPPATHFASFFISAGSENPHHRRSPSSSCASSLPLALGAPPNVEGPSGPHTAKNHGQRVNDSLSFVVGVFFEVPTEAE